MPPRRRHGGGTLRGGELLEEAAPLIDREAARLGVSAAVVWGRPAEAVVRWSSEPSGGRMAVRVVMPDYLDDAPPGVVADMAAACIRRAVTAVPFEMPASAAAWMGDPTWAPRWRGRWMARTGAVEITEDLGEWADIVRSAGLDPGDTAVGWSRRPSTGVAVSRLMRTAALPLIARSAPLSDGARGLLYWTAVCRASAGWPVPSPTAAAEAVWPGRGVHAAELAALGVVL